MKIVFMGTPELVCPILENLYQQHEVVLVVTQPNRSKGRGQKLTTTPIKEKALKLGLPVAQPLDLKDPQWIKTLKSYNADLFFVVAYSILPPEVFNLPRLGSINLHFSLLPKFRGSAPVQWAIIKGKKITGISLFFLDEKVDHGKIIAQKSLKIKPDDNTKTLSQNLVTLSLPLIQETLKSIQNKRIQSLEQKHTESTKAPKLFKRDGFINWNQSAQVIQNQILGMNPFPIAYSFWNNHKKIRIYQSKFNRECTQKEFIQKPSGTVFMNQKNLLEVICQVGSISLLEVQLEGKSIINSRSFFNGIQNKQDLSFLLEEPK